MPAENISRYQLKTRSLPGQHYIALRRAYFATGSTAMHFNWPSKQATYSIGHNTGAIGRKTDEDVGGNFWTSTTSHKITPEKVNLEPYPNVYYRGGPLFAKSPLSADALPPNPGLSSSQVKEMGAAAIAGCEPTSSPVDLVTFLGETVQAFPTIVGRELFKSRVDDYRKLGSEYLNIEFGWKPFVSEIRGMAQRLKKSDKIIQAYKRNANKPVHRRFDFPKVDNITTTTPVSQVVNPAEISGDSNFWLPDGNRGTLTTQTRTKQHVWFEGLFQYYLNVGDEALADQIGRWQDLADHLLGIELTPEVLWNLTPWSWLLDWHGSVGTFFSNASAFTSNNLVMRYGYLMETVEVSKTYTLSGLRPRGQAPITVQQTFKNVRKSRWRASPFGFTGFDMPSYTAEQLAILGALGIAGFPKNSM